MSSFDVVFKYMPYLIKGLWYTVLVSVEAIIIALCVGMILTIIRAGKNKILTYIVNIYISFVRGTPLLVQIFIIYYALAVLGLDIPAFESGVIALSLNSGGFIAEIMRGGLSAIPKGQTEAAVALGMSKIRIWFRIIFPQVFGIILPQLTNEFINVIKVSPLLSVISVVELTRAAQKVVSQTYVTLPFYFTIAVLYFIINSGLEVLVKYQEKRNSIRK